MGNNNQHQSQQSSSIYAQQKMLDGQKLLKVGQNEIKFSISHRSIGAFTFKDPYGKTGKGSGILISKNLVFTAAHNLVCKLTNKKHTDFRFYLAPNGIVEQYFKIESYRYPNEFTNAESGKSSIYDYGLVFLKESEIKIKHTTFCELFLTCFECIGKNGQRHISDLQLQIYGYPFDSSLPNYTPHNKKQDKVQLYQYGLTKEGKSAVVNSELRTISYNISTLPAHSGCPVISLNNIIALHLGSSIKEKDFNLGRLITMDVLQNLYLWSKEMKASSFIVNTSSICKHYRQSKISSAPRQEEIRSQKQVNVLDQSKSKPVLESKHLSTSQSLLKQGDDYFLDEQYQMALQRYLQALSRVQKQKQKGCFQSIQILFNIGTMFLQQRNYPKTIDYFKECSRVCLRHNKKDRTYAYCHTNLGVAYLQIQDFKLAAQSFQQSLSVYQQSNIVALAEKTAVQLIKCYKELKEEKSLGEVSKRYKLKI